MVYAFSMFVSPNIGGFMKDYLPGGHRQSCDVWFFINITAFLILFIFNGDIRVFSENREFQRKLAELSPDNEEENNIMMAKSKASIYSTSRRHFSKVSFYSQRRVEKVLHAKSSIFHVHKKDPAMIK